MVRSWATDDGWTLASCPHPILNLGFEQQVTGLGKCVRFEDGVFYTEEEVAYIKSRGGITRRIHTVKKIFNGSVAIE